MLFPVAEDLREQNAGWCHCGRLSHMKSAVIYARLSDVRKGDTDGIERQLREAEAVAKRLGLKVVERLIDNDISAADRRKARPAYQRLMEGIATNQWGVVVVRSLDRWVRRPRELEDIIEAVEKSKVRVEAMGGVVDLRTPQGRLMARNMTSFAYHEVEVTRKRVTDWHEDRAARGLAAPGNAGYGFEPDKVTVNKDEAKRIREAARRVLAGEALLSIVRRWNDQGVTMRGAQWRPGALRRVLLAPRIAGLRSHRGVIVEAPATWPAIIDRETFDRVGKILTSPSRRASMSTRDQRLLTGILTCGVGFERADKRPKCGKPLNAKTVKKGERYYCRHCLGTLVAANQVEDFLFGAVVEAVDGKQLVAAVKQLRKNDAVMNVHEQIATIEGELADLAADYGAGEMSRAEWKAAKGGLDGRLTTLRDQAGRQHESSAVETWAGKGTLLRKTWPSLSHMEKRQIITATFADIIVKPAIRGHNRFNADRLELVPTSYGSAAAA